MEPQVIFYGTLAAMALISIAYFVGDTHSPLWSRLIASAHGVLGAILLMAAVAVADAGKASRSLEGPYCWCFLLPIASIVYSFIAFRGNRSLHLLQAPNLVCLAAALFFGAITIGADPI